MEEVGFVKLLSMTPEMDIQNHQRLEQETMNIQLPLYWMVLRLQTQALTTIVGLINLLSNLVMVLNSHMTVTPLVELLMLM